MLYYDFELDKRFEEMTDIFTLLIIGPDLVS